MAFAPDGNLYVAFTDENNGSKISVMKYNISNNQWDYIGGRLAFNEAAISVNLKISPNGTLFISFDDVQGGIYLPSVMFYNTSTNQWQYVGQRWIAGPDGWGQETKLAISPNGNIYVAFWDRSGGKATVMSYNSNNYQWNFVGPRAFSPKVSGISIVVDKTENIYLSYINDENKAIREKYLMSYINNQWVPLDKNYSEGSFTFLTLYDDANIYISDQSSISKYDGNKLQNLPSVKPYGPRTIAVDKNGKPYTVTVNPKDNYRGIVLSYY